MARHGRIKVVGYMQVGLPAVPLWIRQPIEKLNSTPVSDSHHTPWRLSILMHLHYCHPPDAQNGEPHKSITIKRADMLLCIRAGLRENAGVLVIGDGP